MRPVGKVLHFPLAGVGRNLTYRDSNQHREDGMYPTPDALNVWPAGPFESRLRGGSRPGLIGFSSEDTGTWCWPNGDPIFWADGEPPVGISDFAITDESAPVHIVDPHEMWLPDAQKGNAPASISASTFYRARLIVAEGTVIYASRASKIHDFDYGADMDDAGRAIAFNVADADRKGDPITALIGVNDRDLYVCTANSIWMYRGDLIHGERVCLSGEVGVVGPNAWTWDGKSLYVLSPRGLYKILADNGHAQWWGEALQPVSPDRVPAALLGESGATLAYDPYFRGVHIILPSDSRNNAVHWFLDERAGGLWPVQYASASIQPAAVGRVKNQGREFCVFLCHDEEWRCYDTSIAKDAGTAFQSFVDIGPFSLNQATDSGDAMLTEITATLAEAAMGASVSVRAGHSAEEADKSATVRFSADLMKGWHNVLRPRVRGVWFVLRIQSTARWAYESVEVRGQQLGRLR